MDYYGLPRRNLIRYPILRAGLTIPKVKYYRRSIVDIKEARALRRKGLSYAKIAKRMGHRTMTVYNALERPNRAKASAAAKSPAAQPA